MFVFLTTEHTEAQGIYGRNACKRGTGISHEAQSLRFLFAEICGQFFRAKTQSGKVFYFFAALQLRSNFWQTGTSRRNRDINFSCPLFRFLTVAEAQRGHGKRPDTDSAKCIYRKNTNRQEAIQAPRSLRERRRARRIPA